MIEAQQSDYLELESFQAGSTSTGGRNTRDSEYHSYPPDTIDSTVFNAPGYPFASINHSLPEPPIITPAGSQQNHIGDRQSWPMNNSNINSGAQIEHFSPLWVRGVLVQRDIMDTYQLSSPRIPWMTLEGVSGTQCLIYGIRR
jgi:hypothetical protein